MRRIAITGMLSLALCTGTASATADQLSREDPVGDVVIHHGEGQIERNARGPVDLRGGELVAGRYRTRLSVEMTDVRKRFFDRFTFEIEFTGDNDVSLQEKWFIRRDGTTGIGTGGTGPYDCAFPRIRLSPGNDTLTYSMLNDCLDNPDAVKAKLKVRYDPNEQEHATDRTAFSMVSY